MLPRRAMEWPFFSSKWDATCCLGALQFGQEKIKMVALRGEEKSLGFGRRKVGLYRPCEGGCEVARVVSCCAMWAAM